MPPFHQGRESLKGLREESKRKSKQHGSESSERGAEEGDERSICSRIREVSDIGV